MESTWLSHSKIEGKMDQSQNNHQNEKFVPKGAIAFFGIVLLIMATIWFFVYFIMIKQA